jgi:predicted house-cleaning noncanonical NTP pyrophosphatase (MazG superfamily)
MTSIEELREGLYAECGRRSVACRNAADYYIALIKNPCYPPAGKMTHKMRRYYMEIIMRHGRPPRCDVKALVEERLRGTILEKYAQEIAEFAELIREKLRATSRVAAAVAAAAVAERYRVNATRESIAARFGVSCAAMRAHLRHAFKLYTDMQKALNKA